MPQCVFCGAEFAAVRSSAKYCSRRCKSASIRKKKKAANPVLYNCIFCGSVLTGQRRKCCGSVECERKRERGYFAKRYREHRDECRAKFDRWHEAHRARSRAPRMPSRARITRRKEMM